MTADELKARTIGLVIRKHSLTEEQVKLADSAAEDALDGYRKHDAAIDPGLILVDEVDPVTGQHKTVQRQVHPPRPVAPYNFDPKLVYWLERQIMQRLGI